MLCYMYMMAFPNTVFILHDSLASQHKNYMYIVAYVHAYHIVIVSVYTVTVCM